MDTFEKGGDLIREFKGDRYVWGKGVLGKVGKLASSTGRRMALVCDRFPGSDSYLRIIAESISAAGADLIDEIQGPGPNCPREDLFRIADRIKSTQPDGVISFGGGSTIDSGKAAEVLRTLGGEIDRYFGTDKVSEALAATGKELHPHIAIQTAASSGAHLTKYSNITDVATGQKKLVVDEAIVPPLALFDYEVTYSAPAALTLDGALDGIAHSLEVLYGAVGKPGYGKAKSIAEISIALVVNHLPRVIQDPKNAQAREALCLATDLGGYAIMIGGTNGGHLTSFSLVDILSHGRACAIMNPYYSVFFAPAIEDALRTVGAIYKEAGYLDADLSSLKGRDLGMAVAEGMFRLAERVGFPTRLDEVKDFSAAHIEKALRAAKNPQLEMKLKNMPVPLTADVVDEYMRPVLEAAAGGDLTLIKNVQ